MIQREKKLTSECPLFEICYLFYKAIKRAGMLYKAIVFVIQNDCNILINKVVEFCFYGITGFREN